MLKKKIYEYRYIRHDARVHYIGKNVCEPFQRRMLYTEPFTSREQNLTRNVIVGFLSPALADARLEQMCDVDLVDVPIGDLKQMAHVLKMPLIVELHKSTCPTGEVIDIYYYMPDTQSKIKL